MSNKPYIKHYPKLGDIFYKRDTRFKRLSARIDRTGKITVNIPFFVTFEVAEHFVLSKQDIILKKQQQLLSLRKTSIINNLSTKLHELKLVPSSEFLVTNSGNSLTLFYPSNLPIDSEEVQQNAAKVLEYILRLEAKAILPKRIAQIATTKGFKYNKVTIKNTKSRWGSCSSSNNINLSLNLMRLPDHLIDYIILHELCHTVEKNHGKGFWTLLDSKCEGRAHELAMEVKQFSAYY